MALGIVCKNASSFSLHELPSTWEVGQSISQLSIKKKVKELSQALNIAKDFNDYPTGGKNTRYAEEDTSPVVLKSMIVNQNTTRLSLFSGSAEIYKVFYDPNNTDSQIAAVDRLWNYIERHNLKITKNK